MAGAGALDAVFMANAVGFRQKIPAISLLAMEVWAQEEPLRCKEREDGYCRRQEIALAQSEKLLRLLRTTPDL